MIDQPLTQLLFLLGAAVVVMMTFLFLRIPTSLGYLLVGVILGPYTIGPTLDSDQISLLAEYGIVFLLFTVGLSYSIPQIHALRNQVLGLGTAQVVLTTVVVGFLAWLARPAGGSGAFVVGAVFAQSSTTVISRQLLDQKEEGTRHGRLGTALSVFQDVTSVPFVVIFPRAGRGRRLRLTRGVPCAGQCKSRLGPCTGVCQWPLAVAPVFSCGSRTPFP
jgi:CPA2 family monovalent cation:H+ antiporter-2